MKLFEQSQTLNYSWDVVTTANWIKYPNEVSTHVLSVDILDRSVDAVTGVLRTERLICCKQSAPSILRTIGIPIPEVAWFREVSYLDPKTREYTATSVNLTMRNIMVVKETCVYKEMRERMEEVKVMAKKVEDKFDELKKEVVERPGLLASLSSRGFFFGSGSGSGNGSGNGSDAPSIQVVASSNDETLSQPQPTHSTQSTSMMKPSASTTSFASFFSRSSSSSDLTAEHELEPQSNLTEFIQTAEFHAQVGISSVKRMMEDAAASRFQANAAKGLKGLESVILRVLEEAKQLDG
ncbi:MSF1-domain-containing protein [Rhizoclosmatium globosum]|uniref:MSF1-domain-containing protein n=1 Tax=Rhizoclosmatium globosum TaxID=329046 RepID=A0A1Y2BWG2_9FUNG|nr:MSF1-domain-containing protein [Rhizoclosmatium globosum]|eukprot:ORY39088.1 MSF1-domain-containing protein [Rhizoclosmatium globosum]